MHILSVREYGVIAQGQPLIVDHLHTGDSEYDGYVIGGKNGLTIVERIR